jgi:hypothetical protein
LSRRSSSTTSTIALTGAIGNACAPLSRHRVTDQLNVRSISALPVRPSMAASADRRKLSNRSSCNPASEKPEKRNRQRTRGHCGFFDQHHGLNSEIGWIN